jgi:hypothetical protein
MGIVACRELLSAGAFDVRREPCWPCRSHAIGAASRVAALVAAFGPLREPRDVAAACRFDPIVSKESASTPLLPLATTSAPAAMTAQLRSSP